MKKILLSILACAAVFTACKKESATVYVSEIKLEEKSIQVVEGATCQIKATALPENAANKKLSYTPDNSGVCTVNETGLVTAVKVGQAKVIVAATDGSKASIDCIINVVAKAIPITKIEISNTALNMKVGEEFTLSYKVYPENTTTKDVIFGFKDNEVIKVDALSGKVTALKAGTSEVVALSMTDGVQSDICAVTVIEPKPMFLRFKSALMRVGGKTMEQEVWYGSSEEFGDREKVKEPVFTTGDAGIASVEASKLGAVFTAVAAGETVIKAADADGNFIECPVKVMAPSDKSYDYNYGVAIDLCNDATGWASGYHKVDGQKVFDKVYVDTENKVSGTGCIAVDANTGYCFFQKTFDTDIDVSAVNNPALFIRFYISDPTKITFDAGGQIELCSGGKADVEELSFIFGQLSSATDPNTKFNFKQGWNNIVLPFDIAAQNTGFNPKRVNYFRFYQNPNAFGTGLNLKIDQIRVVDWTEFDNCDNFDMWYDGGVPGNVFNYVNDQSDVKEGKGCITVADHIMDGPTSNFRLKMWTGREYAMPINMDLTNSAFKFWLYVSDGEAFKGMHCVFEISSELINDEHNFNWQIAPGTHEFKTGWNEMTFDFANCGGDVSETSKRDVRKMNYFRAVFTPVDAPAKPYTYRIDDFRIVKK